MGHNGKSTVVYVGLARLPQPSVSPAPTIALELEVEASTRRVVAANTNLQFPGLERLLQEVLVGQPVDAIAGRALLELEVRYSAPFASALRAAVQAAVQRAMDVTANSGLSPDGTTDGDGRLPEQATLSSS